MESYPFLYKVKHGTVMIDGRIMLMRAIVRHVLPYMAFNLSASSPMRNPLRQDLTWFTGL